MKVEDLSVTYGQVTVLEKINVTLRKGVLTGIIGPNGAGKSTFLKALVGLVPSDGVITYDDSDDKIAYVPQRQAIDLSYPITVFDMVLMGTYPSLGLFQRPGKKERAAVKESLVAVEMENYAQRQISALSGGQLQRVVIARALVQEANVYLLDEPFAGVDIVSEKIIMHRIHSLQQQGLTVIIVHHDLTKVQEYFEDVLILNKTTAIHGKVADVFTSETIAQAYGIVINL